MDSNIAFEPEIVAVDAPFDTTNGAPTPFGHRWGGEVFRLTREQIAVLHGGGTLALDVQGEYIVFLQADNPQASDHLKT